MKLRKLLQDIPNVVVKGKKEMEISGISSYSKEIAPGFLFLAKRGKTVDGSRFIPEAVAAGAVAVVTDLYDPTLREVAQILHPDPKGIEALLAARFHQTPSDKLFLVGITGTNGKTTTSFLAKHLLNTIYGPCGLIGTIEYQIGEQRYQATHTTPDVTTNHKMLHEMISLGCRSAVMEVTSHALDQGRVEGIEYDVAIYTNLTQDHLDYHVSMENYCDAKRKLFLDLGKGGKKQFPKTAILNNDCAWFPRMKEGIPSSCITYGIETKADLMAQEIRFTAMQTEMLVTYGNEAYSCTLPLIGRFNIYNALAALGVGLSQGFPLFDLVKILRSADQVPGRLERIENPHGLKIYVDFAHSEDALKNVLLTLREITEERIIIVFGCGGDRDKTKRPKMARTCEQYADLCIVTSDNPRSEDPAKIAEEIVAGFKQKQRHFIELDREAAIEKAIRMATPKDLILIAGRGHETQQIFAHYTRPFDDCKVAASICEKMARQP